MYTEMLSAGMVSDPDARGRYLDTIHDETNRLCRLVENVLTYSRLGDRRGGEMSRTVRIGLWKQRTTNSFEQGDNCGVSLKKGLPVGGVEPPDQPRIKMRKPCAACS